MGGSRRRRRAGSQGGSQAQGGRSRGGTRDNAARGRGSGGGKPRERNDTSVSRSDAPIVQELCDVSPFSVFCAFHLGITQRDGHGEPCRRDVARRFDMSDDEFDAYLESHGLSQEQLERRDFDLSSAKLDIQVAPEGISRIELARSLFEEFQESATKHAG